MFLLVLVYSSIILNKMFIVFLLLNVVRFLLNKEQQQKP